MIFSMHLWKIRKNVQDSKYYNSIYYNARVLYSFIFSNYIRKSMNLHKYPRSIRDQSFVAGLVDG